jgi:multisubunit Na+/H+ antiporter MnhG subunit
MGNDPYVDHLKDVYQTLLKATVISTIALSVIALGVLIVFW